MQNQQKNLSTFSHTTHNEKLMILFRIHMHEMINVRCITKYSSKKVSVGKDSAEIIENAMRIASILFVNFILIIQTVNIKSNKNRDREEWIPLAHSA